MQVSRIEPATSENKRHHVHAGAHQLVDGALDRRQVGRQQGDALAVTHLRELFGEAPGVGAVDAVRDLGDVGMPEVAGGLRDLSFDQFQEGGVVRRQHDRRSGR